ncbi:uncharacterized protein LOC144155271 [Haemaphysalis longicornis]
MAEASEAWEFDCPKFFDFQLGDCESVSSPEAYFDRHGDSPLEPNRTKPETVVKNQPVQPTSKNDQKNNRRKIQLVPLVRHVKSAAIRSRPQKPAVSAQVNKGKTAGKANPTMAEFVYNYFTKTPARLRQRLQASIKPRKLKTTVPVTPKLRTMQRAKQREAAKKAAAQLNPHSS